MNGTGGFSVAGMLAAVLELPQFEELLVRNHDPLLVGAEQLLELLVRDIDLVQLGLRGVLPRCIRGDRGDHGEQDEDENKTHADLHLKDAP